MNRAERRMMMMVNFDALLKSLRLFVDSATDQEAIRLVGIVPALEDARDRFETATAETGGE